MARPLEFPPIYGFLFLELVRCKLCIFSVNNGADVVGNGLAATDHRLLCGSCSMRCQDHIVKAV